MLTFFSSQKYSLLLLCVCFLSFFCSRCCLLGFLGILASHFAPSTRCFYTLFPPRKLPTTRDVVHSTTTNGFSPFRRDCVFTSVPPRALSRERERERKRSHHSFLRRPFLRLERESPRVSSVFFNPHRLIFAPKKREDHHH